MKEKPAGHTVLGLIPARGGSKGIPRKNIRLLGGKPLLSYTVSAARESAYLSRVLLSTDDPEIADVGRAEGLDVPFLRPAELGLDSTPMIDVVLHCIHWLQGHGEHYDAVCLLQPTSPIRSVNTIDRCIAELWARDADCVVSVRPVPTEYNPHWVYFVGPDGQLHLSTGEKEPIAARQQLPAALHRDGSVFVAKVKGILARQSLYGERMLGVVSPEAEARDLDTEEQWELLEQRLRSVQV